MNLTELYCHVDDFWQGHAPQYQQQQLGRGVRQRQRAVIETIIDQLKNVSQIEHTRHRSLANFMVNVVCGLVAYSHQPKKPSLHLVGDTEFAILIQN